ncbi:hypothetical protein LCGC14_2390200 [marine sediment metagenome]|uniref:Uncharacterized protein n=1 Tax=marine sediment metagenome TaxID=412755 RepID=A0A0F9BYI2_9ZZZZ
MKTKHILILLLASFLAFFLLGRWTTSGIRNSQNQALIALTDTLSVRSVTIGGLEQTLWEQKQINVTQKQAIAMNLIEHDRLKKLGLRNGAQITKIGAQLVAARDSIPLDFELHPITEIPIEGPSEGVNEGAPGETKNTVQLPVSFTYTEQYLKLNTGIGTNRLGWFNLAASTPLTVTLGNKRTGLFRSTPVVSVTTPSPYLQITDIQMVNTDVKKWYDSWVLPVGAGFGIGVATYYLASGLFGN